MTQQHIGSKRREGSGARFGTRITVGVIAASFVLGVAGYIVFLGVLTLAAQIAL